MLGGRRSEPMKAKQTDRRAFAVIFALASLVGCLSSAGGEPVDPAPTPLPRRDDGGSPMVPAAGGDASSDSPSAADAQAAGSPSCSTLPRNCGPQGDEECCSAPVVPGGAFLRAYDGAEFSSATLPATVGAFELDRFEVTVGRFRSFVTSYPKSKPAAGAGRNESNPLDKGWDELSWNGILPPDAQTLSSALQCGSATWTTAPGANEAKPINCVNWFEAFAFCAWDGKRLPTEAEWNFAASGGNEQRVYPWSSPPQSTNVDTTYANYNCTGDGSQSGNCSVTDILFVGARSPRGDGRWSHADLGGGMWELVMDWSGPYPEPCKDCANLTPGTQRTIKGGSFQDTANVLRSAVRSVSLSPDTRTPNIGFRCARTLRSEL